jgi:N-carbamoyl-L-amino-acid hydrolase
VEGGDGVGAHVGIAPVEFDPALVELADAAVRAEAGEAPRLFSGALHDAAAVSRPGVPTAMLFVQSLGGISHHRDEDTAPEDLEAAVRTLARLAERAIQRASAAAA